MNQINCRGLLCSAALGAEESMALTGAAQAASPGKGGIARSAV